MRVLSPAVLAVLSMLEVSDLRAAYGRIPILNGVGFEVGNAEVVGILGHNGMGKTTLMRTLMGFIPATAGRVVYAGSEITRDPPYARVRSGIGYVRARSDGLPSPRTVSGTSLHAGNQL